MASEPAAPGFEPLGPQHDVGSFTCGSAGLDSYLRDRALADQRARKSRTYVLAAGRLVLGYHSLAAAGVEATDATARARAGQGRQPIPAMLLARLAVSSERQGSGLGEALLIDALRRCANAADVIGARVVLVHAADARAHAFYERYGFQASPTRPLLQMLMMKDVRATLDAKVSGADPSDDV